MAVSETTTPGLYFQAAAPQPQLETLRTDIAGFIGMTARGPLDRPIRIEGWRHYQDIFGALTRDADTAYSLRGYFENGGEVAYVQRLLAPAHATALATWVVGEIDPLSLQWVASAPSGGGFAFARYQILASSPGSWANGMRIYCKYRLRGRNGLPQLDIEVHPVDEPVEYLVGLTPQDLEVQVSERSRYIRLFGLPAFQPAPTGFAGPLSSQWNVLELQNGSETSPGLDEYIAACRVMSEQPEVALLAAPDMYRMPDPDIHPYRFLSVLAALTDQTLDRQALLALPSTVHSTQDARQWVALRILDMPDGVTRSLAVYHPWLRVDDPLGGVSEPLRTIPAVGHVAGLISRLDRERGAHHTPANAVLFDCVDVEDGYDLPDQGVLVQSGINPVRCRRGKGLEVWGGRTLVDASQFPQGLYLAHRRLIHRLVRAIRRVAEPLVFDINGPALWLTLVRAMTTIFLEAYRAGALKGERAEQAFRVRCDEDLNPAFERSLGRVYCELQVAPAVPMEFITLRIALSRQGTLEVIGP
jgi:uncharacterized protein